MSFSSRMARRAAVAASVAAVASGLSSVSYPSFTASTMPTGAFAVPMGGANTFASGTTITVDASSRMKEPNSANVNGTYRSAAVFAERMAPGAYSVTVGNANISTSDRGFGCGMSNDDGSVIVFCMVFGNTNAPRIYTYISGTVTPVGTAGSGFSGSASDTITLKYTVSSGIATYTVYKNGTTMGATWTDSSNVVGTPGRHPCVSFHHVYSSYQYASPGCKSLTAALN